MSFSVSVIIPVYNCESYIEKAITSAIQQPEVFEVVVVNDGSIDNTQEILNKLTTENQKIKVYHHENKINKGRSASRNLGIKKVTGNYIAFLDADDYYLPNRFTNDKLLFKQNKDIDGVYNAIGVEFYREAVISEIKKLELTTVTEKIKPEDLFETLLYYKKGHFHIDGLTVKRSVFDKIGYFNEVLIVAEDTELFFRMALKCQLQTGIIDKPVAVRGVHEANVFNNKAIYEKFNMKVYETLVFWATKNKISAGKIDHLLNILWVFKFSKTEGIIKDCGYWLLLFLKTPRLLFTKLSIKYFPVVRLRKKLFPFLYKQQLL